MAADPRRFPGLLFVHILLILVLLAIACVAVALRTLSDGPGPIARAAKAAEAGLGPLAAPPTRPANLDARLKAAGFEVPKKANVYAVRIIEGPEGRIYEQYEAGGGALASDFWPASSIKVLAALGALDFLRSLGYTGGATVTFDDGSPSRTLRSIYDPAIRVSSNYDYDLLVRIAGLDRLNHDFLTPEHGFPATSINRSYAGVELDESPAMIIEEGDRRTYVPVRKAEREPECKTGNCSNLFEMTESVRRIVLGDQLPAELRFDLDPADVAALSDALLHAEGFFQAIVKQTLGSGARIWSKPGDAEGRDCLDVTLIESKAGKKFLVAASVPHSEGGCEALARLAKGVLVLLSA